MNLCLLKFLWNFSSFFNNRWPNKNDRLLNAPIQFISVYTPLIATKLYQNNIGKVYKIVAPPPRYQKSETHFVSCDRAGTVQVQRKQSFTRNLLSHRTTKTFVPVFSAAVCASSKFFLFPPHHSDDVSFGRLFIVTERSRCLLRANHTQFEA